MNDYLWDRGGEADEDVRKLEELLGAFRSMPELRVRRTPRVFFVLPFAAMVLLGIALPAFIAYRNTSWHGAIAVYGPGAVIRARTPLRIETPSIGIVDVGAGTT
ncbi:MAG TPA: hypothetical protein VG323_12115, partial [Thermoanaerobaculia bacterium]|nr:hypothetical protein [Thermoanaerobaculia bacterium]